MNRDEARAQLDAATLRPQDASEEACAVARNDAELGLWLERRTAFDEKVATTMDDMHVPGGLQAQLLAAMNAEVAQTTRSRPVIAMPMIWLAAAAVVVITFAGWWMMQPNGPDWESQALAKVKLIDHGLMRLDHRSPKLDVLKQTLASAGLLSPGKLPANLEKLRTFGCKIIEVAGKPATVICFQIEGREEAHLVIMNRSNLDNPPPLNQPAFTEKEGWQVASWSDGTQSYALMTRSSSDKLKALFAGASKPDGRWWRTA